MQYRRRTAVPWHRVLTDRSRFGSLFCQFSALIYCFVFYKHACAPLKTINAWKYHAIVRGKNQVKEYSQQGQRRGEMRETWTQVKPASARWSSLSMAAAKVPAGVKEPTCIS